MIKPPRFPRISILLMFLVIVPWTIVLVTTLRVSLTSIPEFESKDAEEIDALARALDAYAGEYGEFPPDFTSGDPRQEIDKHLQKIFPDRDTQHDVPPGIDDLGPDNALAFWLKGFYQNNARFPFTGRIYLGQHPITGEEVFVDMAEEEYFVEVHEGESVSLMTAKRFIPIKNEGEDIMAHKELVSKYQELALQQGSLSVLMEQSPPLHTFDSRRLSKRGAYRPRCCAAPLVYFRADTYPLAKYVNRSTWGIAQPYQSLAKDGRKNYVESQRFQLICAGRDCFFGSGSVTVAGAAYHEGHADNFTNFSLSPLGTQRMIAWRQETVLARNLSLLVAAICIVAYPVVNALRRREDDLVALARITRKQLSSMECSDSWRQELSVEKRNRRDQAIERMRTSATDRGDSAQTSSPDFSSLS